MITFTSPEHETSAISSSSNYTSRHTAGLSASPHEGSTLATEGGDGQQATTEVTPEDVSTDSTTTRKCKRSVSVVIIHHVIQNCFCKTALCYH